MQLMRPSPATAAQSGSLVPFFPVSLLRSRLARKLLLLAVPLLLAVLSSMVSLKGGDGGSSVEMGSPHVVVVGGGLAGLAAAAGALARGARVTLLDKEAGLGGNSMKATSGINAAATEHQTRLKINDTPVLFAADIIKSGQGRTRVELARALSARSAGAIKFLDSVLPVPLASVAILGGHSVPRTHRFDVPADGKPLPIGFTIVRSVKEAILENPSLTVRQKAKVTDVEIVDLPGAPGAKRVQAVTFQDLAKGDEAAAAGAGPQERVVADSVVFAAGGFAANADLVHELAPQAPKCSYTTNGAFSTGDLLLIARKWGLKTEGLDQVQVHPTGFVDPKKPLDRTKFLCPEVVRGVGGVLVDRQGRRFTDELLRRDQVSAAIREHGGTVAEWGLDAAAGAEAGRVALLVMNEEVRRGVGIPNFDFYCARGFIQKFDNMRALADHFSLPHLVESVVTQYGTAADKTAKKVFPTKYTGEEVVFAAFVTPAVHYCMGGMSVNDEMQLSTTAGGTVVNLFAAGEAAGGLHGANRLGGNGLLESTTFGYLAGQNAVDAVGEAAVSAPTDEAAVDFLVSSLNDDLGLPAAPLTDYFLLRLRFAKSFLHTLPAAYGTGFRLATPKGEVADAVLVPAGVGRADFFFKSEGDLSKFGDLAPGERISAKPLAEDALGKRLGKSLQHAPKVDASQLHLAVDTSDHRALNTAVGLVRALKNVHLLLQGPDAAALAEFFKSQGAAAASVGLPPDNFVHGLPS